MISSSDGLPVLCQAYLQEVVFENNPSDQAIFLKFQTSTKYYSNSTGLSVTSNQISPFIERTREHDVKVSIIKLGVFIVEDLKVLVLGRLLIILAPSILRCVRRVGLSMM
jgi:hypothetical protein